MKIKYSSNVMYGMTKLDCNECIHVIRSIKDNKKNGEQKQWDKNGQLFIQKYYINDKLDGEYKEWFSTGQLCKQTYYHNGKLDGDLKRWHFNGQMHVHCYFKNDECNGEFIVWDYNGKLRAQLYYKNDLEISGHKESINENDKLLVKIYNEEHDRDKIVI